MAPSPSRAASLAFTVPASWDTPAVLPAASSVWTGWRRLVRSTPTSCLIWPDATPCRMVAWIWSSTWTGGGEAEASTDVEVASAEGSGCEADRAAPAGRELATCAEGVADVFVDWAAGGGSNCVYN